MQAISTNNTLSITQTVQAIKAMGAKRTVLVQGGMGTGKSSLLKMLAAELPTHTPIYLDMTRKDIGDLMVPMFDKVKTEGDKQVPVVRYAYNEELGLHLDRPVCVMFDEFGKAPRPVQNACLQWMLERTGYHPDSILFATTNYGLEGVGDLLQAHARDRMTIINMRAANSHEWCDWGVANNIHHIMTAYVKDNPQLMHSFMDYGSPEENLSIYFPQDKGRTKFVTPRGLHAASDWIWAYEAGAIDKDILLQCLIGTIGEYTARNLSAYISLGDQIPTLQEIKDSPETATIPQSPAAVCMVVFRTLATIQIQWADAWMKYLNRLDKPMQGLFVARAVAKEYPRKNEIVLCKAFQQWCVVNNYIVRPQ